MNEGLSPLAATGIIAAVVVPLMGLFVWMLRSLVTHMLVAQTEAKQNWLEMIGLSKESVMAARDVRDELRQMRVWGDATTAGAVKELRAAIAEETARVIAGRSKS